MATGNQHNGGTSDISILSSFDSLEILPVPILVVDSMFRIAFANRCFGDLLELRREELECSPLAQHISARDPISVIGVDRILKEAEFTVSLRTRDCSIVDLCCSPTPVELADESVGRLLVFHDSKRLRTAIIEEERAVLLASERAQELEKARVDLQNANRQIAHFETLMEEQLEVRTSMLKKEMAEAVCLRQRAEFQAKRLMELEEKKNSLFESLSHELRDPIEHLLNPLRKELHEHPNNENLETALNSSVRLLYLVDQLPTFHEDESAKERSVFDALINKAG